VGFYKGYSGKSQQFRLKITIKQIELSPKDGKSGKPDRKTESPKDRKKTAFKASIFPTSGLY
jgi:hypothetical protein